MGRTWRARAPCHHPPGRLRRRTIFQLPAYHVADMTSHVFQNISRWRRRLRHRSTSSPSANLSFVNQSSRQQISHLKPPPQSVRVWAGWKIRTGKNFPFWLENCARAFPVLDSRDTNPNSIKAGLNQAITARTPPRESRAFLSGMMNGTSACTKTWGSEHGSGPFTCFSFPF